MASESGTLYIGVTNDLIRRVGEHKQDLVKGFSQKYKCHKLIYYEQTEDVYSAMEREKQLKRWSRGKKEELIRGLNAKWMDLSDDLF